jgi:hypothetical protein
VNRIKSIEWRVNYILSSNSYQRINSPTVLLRFTIIENVEKKILSLGNNNENNNENNNNENITDDKKIVRMKAQSVLSLGMNQDKFRVFLQELKMARDIMKSL